MGWRWSSWARWNESRTSLSKIIEESSQGASWHFASNPLDRQYLAGDRNGQNGRPKEGEGLLQKSNIDVPSR